MEQEITSKQSHTKFTMSNHVVTDCVLRCKYMIGMWGTHMLLVSDKEMGRHKKCCQFVRLTLWLIEETKNSVTILYHFSWLSYQKVQKEQLNGFSFVWIASWGGGGGGGGEGGGGGLMKEIYFFFISSSFSHTCWYSELIKQFYNRLCGSCKLTLLEGIYSGRKGNQSQPRSHWYKLHTCHKALTANEIYSTSYQLLIPIW